jgi:hypothetical protein
MNNKELIETLRKMLESNCVAGIPARMLIEMAIERIQDLERQLNQLKVT